MTIYEAIGLAWVVLTSALATVQIFYCALVGLKKVISPGVIHTRTIHQEIPGVTVE